MIQPEHPCAALCILPLRARYCDRLTSSIQRISPSFLRRSTPPLRVCASLSIGSESNVCCLRLCVPAGRAIVDATQESGRASRTAQQSRGAEPDRRATAAPSTSCCDISPAIRAVQNRWRTEQGKQAALARTQRRPVESNSHLCSSPLRLRMRSQNPPPLTTRGTHKRQRDVGRLLRRSAVLHCGRSGRSAASSQVRERESQQVECSTREQCRGAWPVSSRACTLWNSCPAVAVPQLLQLSVVFEQRDQLCLRSSAASAALGIRAIAAVVDGGSTGIE